MNVMQGQFVTVLEAIRRAQAELAAYLGSGDHDAELTIAKLVGILDRREVVRAARLLDTLACATARKHRRRSPRRHGKPRALISPVADPKGFADPNRVPAIPA
jgi:hypothetical protein